MRGSAAIALVALAALLAGCGGDEPLADVGSSTAPSISTTTRPSTTTTVAFSEIEFMGWTDFEVSAVRIDPIPARPPTRLEPGQSLASVHVAATFTDTQATNGNPADLTLAVSIQGSKGKGYRTVDVAGGWGSSAISDFDALDAKPPVVAPGRVEGTLYWIIDSNDDQLRPFVGVPSRPAPVEPTSRPAASPEEQFIDEVRAQIPGLGGEQPNSLVLRSQEVCEHGRNGYRSDPAPRFGLPALNYSPAAALAHTHSLKEDPSSEYRQFTLLAISAFCPDVQPVADAVLAGEVPPHPNPNVRD